MTTDPPRLLTDASAPAHARTDLAHAASASIVGVNYEAGLAQLRTNIASRGAVAASGTTASVATKVAVGLLLVGGLRIAGSLYPRMTGSTAQSTSAQLGLKTAATNVATNVQPERIHNLRSIMPVPRHGVDKPDRAIGGTLHRDAMALPKHHATTEHVVSSREAAMIAHVRALLAQDEPQHALALTERIAHKFPGGHLSEEREALAIRALSAAEYDSRARARATAFLAEHQHSAHAAFVREIATRSADALPPADR